MTTENSNEAIDIRTWINETSCECKQLFVQAIYDPTLSGEIFEFIYNYLSRSDQVNMISFNFNDENKFIDITFEAEDRTDFPKCSATIKSAFDDLFRYLAYSTSYNRLMNLNLSRALIFKDVVINHFGILDISMYNTMLMNFVDGKLLVRVTLV